MGYDDIMKYAVTSQENIQGWSPETDVDGLDTGGKLLSEVNNIEYRHGFVRNVRDGDSIAFPSAVITAINTDSYELLSGRRFTHGTQGVNELYVLWKEYPLSASPGTCHSGSLSPILTADTGDFTDVDVGDIIYVDNKYKTIIEVTSDTVIVVDDDMDFTEEAWYYVKKDERLRVYLNGALMPIHIGTSATTIYYDSKPERINYAMYGGQLKINLNCSGSYADGDTILNLTLLYRESVIYDEENGYEWVDGWLLTPRWLALAYRDDSGISFQTEGSTYIPEARIDTSNYTEFPVTLNGVSAAAQTFSIVEYSDSIEISDVDTLSELTIEWKYTGSQAEENMKITIQYTDGYEEISYYPLSHEDTLTNTVKIPERYFDIQKIFIQKFSEDGVIGQEYLSVWSITLKGYESEGFLLLTKNFDGQRSITSSVDPVYWILPIWGNVQIFVRSDAIDWRVSEYEFYAQVSQNIYTLIGKKGISDDWEEHALATGVLGNIKYINTDETMNFNYGLGSVGVSTQSMIYSETIHRNRVYFVRNDEKVYVSHIAGSGLPLPDSFPYSEESRFGYFLPEGDKVNKAVATSPLDELIIIQNNGLRVYKVEYSGGYVHRKLSLSIGEINISSVASLPKELSGLADGLAQMWIDDNGIYLYNGGINSPTNILYPLLKRWWDTIPSSSKASAIGFFNHNHTEYWLAIDGKLLVYELLYKQFRLRDNDGIVSYFGYDSAPMVLFSAGIYKYDESENYKTFDITSHYSAGTLTDKRGLPFRANLMDDKILQELYIGFGDCSSGATVTLTLTVDGYTVDTPITISVIANKVVKTMTYLAVKFNKLKMRIVLNESNKMVSIVSSGFTNHASPAILNADGSEMTPTGYGTGYGTNYGDNF